MHYLPFSPVIFCTVSLPMSDIYPIADEVAVWKIKKLIQFLCGCQRITLSCDLIGSARIRY